MLRNQDIIRPLNFLIGPELFYAPDPLGVDMAIIRAFQKINLRYGMDFSLIRYKGHAKFAKVRDRLADFNVKILMYLEFDEVNPEVRRLIVAHDIIFAPETLVHQQYAGTVSCSKDTFLHCLTTTAASIVAPSVEQFRRLISLYE